MDNKRTWILMAVVIGLTFLWLQGLQPWLAKKYGWKMGPDQATNQPAPDGGAGGAATTPATGSASGTAALGSASVDVGVAAAPVVLGYVGYDADAKVKSPYPLGLMINNRGAALDSVTLNRFRDQYDRPEPYVFQRPYGTASPLSAALATRAITFGGSEHPLHNVYWQPTTAPA